MVLFLASLLRFFLRASSSKAAILSENAVLKKENEILLREVGKKRVHFPTSGVVYGIYPRKGDLFHLTSETPTFLSGRLFPSLPEQTWSSSWRPSSDSFSMYSGQERLSSYFLGKDFRMCWASRDACGGSKLQRTMMTYGIRNRKTTPARSMAAMRTASGRSF